MAAINSMPIETKSSTGVQISKEEDDRIHRDAEAAPEGKSPAGSE